MWLFALFQADTSFGRIVKTAVCGAAAVAFYAGLASTPQSGAQIALSLAVIAALWLHGYRGGRRLSYASTQCGAEVREDEGRIRVAGGGVELVLDLALRTLTVNKVGEFQRLRSGRFEWPFRALAVEPGPGAGSVAKVGAVSGASQRWNGEAATSASNTGSDSIPDAGEARASVREREIDVYWMHPGQGDRLLFSVGGPAEKYEAIERAFSIFAAWIDHEDEARRAIELRHKAEAWQRNWEAKRLAEELDHTRRTEDGPNDETDRHLRVTARAITPSRRW
jgi:hypothetical protein